MRYPRQLRLALLFNALLMSPSAIAQRPNTWHILSQPNTTGLLHGLPQRLTLGLRNQTSNSAMWAQHSSGGSADIGLDMPDLKNKTVHVGFFRSVKWSKEDPVQMRSLSGAGIHRVTGIKPGKYFVGAMIGTVKGNQVLALGVHSSWPEFVTIRQGSVAKIRLKLLKNVNWNEGGGRVYDNYLGEFDTSNPARLVRLQVTDNKGEAVPFCRVTLTTRKKNNANQIHQFKSFATDAQGEVKLSSISRRFTVAVNVSDFVPSTLAARWIYQRRSKLYDPATKPTIPFKVIPFPKGDGKLNGTVHDQNGKPLREFHLEVTSDMEGLQGQGDFLGYGMRIPIVNPKGQFSVSGIAPGKLRVTAFAFDYSTHAYDRKGTMIEIKEAERRPVDVDIQLEAKKLYYGEALYSNGKPAYPGGWTARFTHDINDPRGGESFSLGTDSDGRFRVSLSQSELKLLRENSKGLIEVYGAGRPRPKTIIHIDKLSTDSGRPTKVRIPPIE